MQSNLMFEDRRDLDLLKFKKMYLAGKRKFCLIDLSEMSLSGENLKEIDLKGADLSGSNLDRTDLRNANLRYSNLFGADLTGADLRGTNLKDTNLVWTCIALALYDERTQFPDDFSPQNHQMIFQPHQKVNAIALTKRSQGK